jgi:protein-S-isoprenylcysteine O-methyltransferase Ste14
MSERLWAAVKSVIFATLFVWLWTVGFPRWLQLPGATASWREQPLRMIGFLPITVGAIITLRCMWNFIFIGRGTPAPFDAPKKLVIRGFYRYVRNPMYVGIGLVLIGEAILLASFSWKIVLYGTALFAIVNLFIMLYEEPTLARQFGEEYLIYRKNVPRWIPRLEPWEQSVGDPEIFETGEKQRAHSG